MVQRHLSQSVRESLCAMLWRFAVLNERVLEESDRTILAALTDEIQTAESVQFDVSIADGKVTIQCNHIQYQFDDPSAKGSP